MMAHLPPLGWGEVSTRRDVDGLGVALRSEIAVLGSDLRGEITGLRGEITGLRGEITGLRGELRAEMRTQTRSLFLSLVGLQMTAAALGVAVARVIWATGGLGRHSTGPVEPAGRRSRLRRDLTRCRGRRL